jgi:serine/threonine protein kinase
MAAETTGGVGGEIRPPDGVSSLSWGPLKVLERLGRGGFADVYRAYDPSLQREVALKLLRGDRAGADSDRFLQEARRLGVCPSNRTNKEISAKEPA